MYDTLTLIIANYNNGKYFKDCYDSLVAQTHTNWKAIILDDASTDNSVEIIKKLIQDDDRFTLILNEQNLGYQKTNIKGINLCETEIFARLDPDDALDPEAVELSLKAHNNHPDIGIAHSGVHYCDENLNIVRTYPGKNVSNIKDFYNLHQEFFPLVTFKKRIYQSTVGLILS